MKLSTRRQKVVLDHLDVADVVAGEWYGKSVDRDDIRSAAYLGLCLAALDYNKSMGVPFRAFALVVARRRAFKEHRSARRRFCEHKYDMDDLVSPGASEPSDVLLSAALASLTARQYEALMRVDVMDQTYAEAGRCMGIDRTSVCHHRRTALARLRARLAERSR